MPFGLFVRRELITSTRRGAAFAERRQAVYVAALLIGGCFGVWEWRDWDRESVAGASSFGFAMFAALVALETVLVLGFVAGTAAPAIAGERDRKSLDSLLATRVSSADVVLGALGGTLLRYLNRSAALVPILVLVMYLGGIDPRLVALSVAGLFSTALVTAALAVAVSAGAATARDAVAFTMTLALVLMYLPLLALILLPRIWPAVTPWTAPIAVRLLDGSPLGVVTSLAGMTPRGPVIPQVLRMIAIQTVASVVFVFWAIVRLRPASRAVYDMEGRASLLRALRARWRPRPPCGDDPVLWHAMYSRPVVGEFWRLVERLFNIVWVACFAYGVWLFAAPSFVELLEWGYGPGPSNLRFPELNPMARMLVARVSGSPMIGEPGQSRLDFNIVLRQLTGAMTFVYYLMIAGAAAESIVNERERDTWLGLIVTPLSGWEILRGKMLGVIWKTRALGLVILAAWLVGLLCGALHPLGLLAAVAAGGASCGLFVALGVSRSLWSIDRAQATGRVIAPLTFSCMLGALPFMMPGVVGLVAAVGSPPFQIWSALLSYDDVRDLIRSEGVAQFAVIGVRGVAGARLLLAAWLIGVTAQAVGGLILLRVAVRGFDAAVGRPIRGRSEGSRGCSQASIAP